MRLERAALEDDHPLPLLRVPRGPVPRALPRPGGDAREKGAEDEGQVTHLSLIRRVRLRSAETVIGTRSVDGDGAAYDQSDRV